VDDVQAPDYLFSNETAKYLRISRSTAYTMMRSGQLPAHKVGGRWRIAKADLDAMLAGRPAAESETEAVRRWVESAPPLSEKQRDLIAAAFAGAGE
jgi:excisionase family DNA binding protein